MNTKHLCAERRTRFAGILAGVLLIAWGMPGCSGESSSIMTPEMSEAEEEARQLQLQITTSLRVLDQFVDAYNARAPRALARLHHGKYHFVTSVADEELPETMTRAQMLLSASTMFRSESVLDVNLSMDVVSVDPHPTRRRTMVVETTMNLEVTMEDAFGPPIVYQVDNHPARFLLIPRGTKWAILEHIDMYEEPEGERVILQRTWGQVLNQFLQR